MPNTFGGKDLIDPRRVRAARKHYRYDEVPELAYANALYVSGGKFPSRGWVLLARGDYNGLNPFTPYNLVLQDLGGNPPLTLQNLVIVQARCVSRGLAADPNALYLVELTDQTGILWNRWFEFPTTSQYNVRAPAYPEQFYSASMNGGSPWTWSQMIGDLWNQMGAFLGPYPGLPMVPAWTPESWSFPGMSAWEALSMVLGYLGLTETVDLTLANPFGIGVLGGADAGNTARMTRYAYAREDDWEWIDSGLGRVPLQVQVLFHRRNQYYGTEETVRRDGLQWTSTPGYSVTVPGSFPQATGTHTLWADYTVEYDTDGNPLASSVATANAVAASVVNNFYTRITRSTQGFLRRVYTGALPFATGGLVDGVCWREDAENLGWRTTIVRGGDPPFPEVSTGWPAPR